MTWEQGMDCHPSCKDLLDDCLLKEGCATALGELRNRETDFERALVLISFEMVNDLIKS